LNGATLTILAFFGVLAIALYGLKGFVHALKDFIDQLPEFFASIRRAWEAWQELKRARREAAQQEGSQSHPSV
jgi:predicted PurR-regulated permease PerM